MNTATMIRTTGFPVALREWRRAIGEENVLTDAAALARYTWNVSALQRTVRAVLRPETTPEVQRAVVIANEYRTPLHPISCGKNWGLGSRLPVRDGAVIVDLSRMIRIRKVNVPHHFAVVEPGVTQRQLYNHIRAYELPLVLNVTGASADTSLIGNALDRGVGYFSSRAESLSGLEVVLGNGTVLETGFGHFPFARTAHLYKPGVGPSLDGLFSQSNYGIVTAAGVDLMPRRDAFMAMIAKVDHPAKLDRFVDALAELRRRDVLQTVVHVANQHRTQIAMAPLVYRQLAAGRENARACRDLAERLLEREGFGPWSAVGGIMGTRGRLQEVRREVRRALRGLGSVLFMTDSLIAHAKRLAALFRFVPRVRQKRALLAAVEPLYGLAKGIPTDAAMDSVYWPVGDLPPSESADPDQSQCGMLHCLPILPADGKAVREAAEYIERIFARHGFVPYVTFNLMDGRAMECVINSAFDRRDPSQVAAAHACNDELTDFFIRQGYPPYRVGVQSMPMIVNERDSYWQTVRDLKRVLDPNQIISPGRYNLV